MPSKNIPVRAKKQPRLLIIDSFPAGYPSATGKLKSLFIEDWPNESVLQVCVDLKSDSLAMVQGKGYPLLNMVANQSADELVLQCREFSPEAIYFRPNEYELIFAIAERLIAEIDCPLIIHMMDDWPERLRIGDPEKYHKINPILRRLIVDAVVCLSISEKMSAAYTKRYACKWVALANGVDLNEYLSVRTEVKSMYEGSQDFVLRYSGGLADDMTFQSVVDVAETINSLRPEYQIRLEIYTMKWYLSKAGFLNDLDGVTVTELVADEAYIYSLVSANALLVAYNFDIDTIRYTSLSMANKLPECLASATPVLAYGPTSIASIEYLVNAACAKTVTARDLHLLREAILYLLETPKYCERLGLAGRTHASKYLKKRIIQNKFRSFIQAGINKNSRKAGLFSRLVYQWKKWRKRNHI